MVNAADGTAFCSCPVQRGIAEFLAEVFRVALELGDDVGMILRHVAVFPGIVEKIVQFEHWAGDAVPAVTRHVQLPAIPTDCVEVRHIVALV